MSTPVPICLQLRCTNALDNGIINGNSTFQASFTLISFQQYFDPVNFFPLYYTGLDIKIGQWIGSNIPGYAWQILQIISATDNDIEVILEDEDNFNQNIDSAGFFGYPQIGLAYTYIYFEF